VTEGPTFLSVEHVRTIHRRVIGEFGGDPAVLDEGLLESAVMMPAAQYAGGFLHPDIPASHMTAASPPPTTNPAGRSSEAVYSGLASGVSGSLIPKPDGARFRDWKSRNTGGV